MGSTCCSSTQIWAGWTFLRSVEPIGGLEALDTVEMELIEGRRVRVLTLDHLIEVKAHTGRRKDLIVEQELRAIRTIRGSREP